MRTPRTSQFIVFSLVFTLLCAFSLSAAAQEQDKEKSKQQEPNAKAEKAPKPKGPPPMLVATAKLVQGEIHPQGDFVGTVYFPEVAQVASEVSGRVDSINVEEGAPVKKGQELATLTTDLAQKELAAAKANQGRVQTLLENAQKELERTEKLFKKRSVAEQEYDNAHFQVLALQNQARSLKATTERLSLVLEKSKPQAPFDGVVLERYVDRGEWLTAGSPIAEIARDDVVDIVVNLPQELLGFVRIGGNARVMLLGQELEGKVHAVVPKGDQATRTFPVKVRIKNTMNLAQGMEARVSAPRGAKLKALMAPRDAIIQFMGQVVVWTIDKGQAVMIPVSVLAYEGLNVAIQSMGPPIKEGMDVVIKGNERLRPGAPVRLPQPPAKDAAAPAQKQNG